MILTILHVILTGIGCFLLGAFGMLAFVVAVALVAIAAFRVLRPFEPYLDRFLRWALK
jgi:hypothetical protein